MGARAVPWVKVCRFWELKREGYLTREAATRAGFSPSYGKKLVRKHGGVAPTLVKPPVIDERGRPQSRYLSPDERDLIARKLAVGLSVRQIAKDLDRAASTISREVERNARVHRPYSGAFAQRCADTRRARPKVRKLELYPALWAYVWEKFSGDQHWSPQQISARLRLDFPDDEVMRISPEAIYQCLFLFPKGEMKDQVKRSMRSGRTQRRSRTAQTGDRIVPRELLIANRPAQVEDRAVPGDWEGDCILGARGLSQIGTLVERTTRFTILLHLPGTRTGDDLRTAITAGIIGLPAHLKRSITWDQGSEMRSSHPQIAIDHGIEIWFCNPHSPWERGTNENTNGLLRQYFPKGTDLSQHSIDDLNNVAAALNNRPRATLGFRTPHEAFTQLLSSPH